MKVQNTTIFMGDATLKERHEGVTGKKDGQKNVFAGDLKQNFDPIAQKRQEARKKAMKIVTDTWSGDRKIDDDLEERRNKIGKYQETMKKSGTEVRRINDERAALKETYGIEDDSQEEQDLRLLERQADAERGRGGLTLEERKRLAEIEKAGGPTEYQKRSLELYKDRQVYQDEYDEAYDGVKAESAAINAIKQERLKSDPMLKAQQAAEDVMEAASDEIVGMLVDEAKDHIDEEMEEKKEAAQEKAEKEKEEQEKIEKAKENKEEKEEYAEDVAEAAEALTDIMTGADGALKDVQKEIKKIMDQMKLVEEDIKGAAVDTVG